VEKKVVVAFEQQEWQEILRIVIDRDKDSALQTLKEIVKKIESQQQGQCRPAFEIEGLMSNLRKQEK